MNIPSISIPSIPVPGFIQDRVDRNALIQGLGATIVLYIIIFAGLAFTAGGALEKMEMKLASETVQINGGSAATPVSVAEHIPTHQQQQQQHSPATDADAHNTTAQHHTPAATARPFVKGLSLTPAPINGFYETTHDGPLPIIDSNQQTPFEAYKKPFTPTGQPLIAIVVRDYGLSGPLSMKVLKDLPAEVSLILSPYADEPEKFQQQARAQGHEIWIDLPAQTEDYPLADPGPQALLSDAGLRQNQDHLNWILSRTSGYAGVAVSIDDSFRNASTLLQKLFGNVFERGLGYFEMNPDAGTSIETMAVVHKAPYARNAVFVEQISLKSLESTARQKGFVIGVVSPYPGHIASLKVWMDTLDAKGFTIAPLSAIAEHSTR